VPPSPPADVAVAPPPSELEKAAASAPVAEFYYPTLLHHNMLDDYHVLIWPQPWFNPDTMVHWPVLLDVDRTPFIAWNKRIGQ
jgi:hypothetical protein